MQNQTDRSPVSGHPSEDDIRNYAYHLYQQSNCLPGQDLGNWFEATACLKANIPSHQSGTRLHHHLSGRETGALAVASTDTRNLTTARVLPHNQVRSKH